MNIGAVKFTANEAIQSGIVKVSLSLGEYFLASFDKLVPPKTEGGKPVVYRLAFLDFQNGTTSLTFHEEDAGEDGSNLSGEKLKAYQAAMARYGRKTKLVGLAETLDGLVAFAGRKPNADTEVKLVYPKASSVEEASTSTD